MQRNRSSYAGNTGMSWSGTSKLIEWTTTTVRSTSIERSVTVGQNSKRGLELGEGRGRHGRTLLQKRRALLACGVATSLDDRVIAIAGAGGLLGPDVAQLLASKGARLALAGRDKAPLDALAAELSDGADTASVDLLDVEATREWARGIVERHRRVDGLVHLVGGWWPSAPIEEASLEDWGRFTTSSSGPTNTRPKRSRPISWRAAGVA